MAIDVPDWLKLTQLAAPSFVGAVSVAVGQTVGSLAVAPSVFATALVVVPVQPANVQGITVVGFTSNIAYLLLNKPNYVGPGYIAPIYGNTDTPLTVSASISPVNPGPNPIIAANVYQIFGAGITQVSNGGQQPLFAQLQASLGRVDQSNLLQNVHIANNIAAGASVTVVNGATPAQITVYGYDLACFPVGAVVGGYQATIEDTTGANPFANVRVNIATAVGQNVVRSSLSLLPFGYLLAPNAGIKVVANAGNVGNIFVEGNVFYTQL